MFLQKPQDISEPVVQDVSNHLDVLALLFVFSTPGINIVIQEAYKLVWYGKTNPLLDEFSNERHSASFESNDPKYEVKVMRELPQSRDLKPFDRSKGQVVALVPGQALNCGIGPSVWYSNVSVTYLSAKDVLRWSKLSEWLDEYEQQNPTANIALSQIQDLTPQNRLFKKLPPSSVAGTLATHVSDLPGNPRVSLDSELWEVAMDFVIGNLVLLALLVALPLIYGGIHLTAWSFHFASQTERLLWKIACIDIMGTIPISVTFCVCLYLITRIVKRLNEPINWLNWICLSPTFLFYALSRIYIVVESFISLRHVPIGVYAAIPWVQNIPHV